MAGVAAAERGVAVRGEAGGGSMEGGALSVSKIVWSIMVVVASMVAFSVPQCYATWSHMLGLLDRPKFLG